MAIATTAGEKAVCGLWIGPAISILTSGWVNARVPAYFQFRKNEDRRERLTVEKKADGSLKIVNALGADIRRLYVADASGHVFEGRDIPAGAERTLDRPSPNSEPRCGKCGPGVPAKHIQRRSTGSADFQQL